METPAAAVGLAVGSVDAFERILFDFRDRTPPEELGKLATADSERRVNRRFAALKDIEPDTSGPASNQLGDILRPVGAKIAPHLSGEQATAWRKAMVMALSDLPADVAITAARAVIHQPMQFLSEVEIAIRKQAGPAIAVFNMAARKWNKLGIGAEIGTIRDRARADSTEAEIEAKRGTVLARTTERDLTEVRQARAALTRWQEYEGKQP